MILLIFKTMLTLFFLCIAGFVARKSGIMDSDFSKKLSDFIIKIAQPFLIISAITNTEYSRDNLALGFTVIGIGILCHCALAVFAKLYTLPIKKINEAKITSFAIIFSNCGFIGLPVAGALLGSKGLFCGAFYQISFNLFLWSYGMLMLGRGRDDIKMNPRKMLLNYGTTPCIIGIVLYLLKPYFTLPDFLASAFDYLGSLCTPMSQIIVGGLIATRSIIPLLKSYKIYLFSVAKLFVFPVMAALFCRLLGADAFMTVFVCVMTSLPCASNSAMFGEIYDIEPEYAAQLVGVTTLLSVISVPAVLYLTELIIAL